jgi:hypothetical protein
MTSSPEIGAAMRRLALIAVLLVPLFTAASAAGKEVQSVKVCGADDCATASTGGVLATMMDVGPPTDPPSTSAPFYELTIAIGDGRRTFERWEASWLPSAERLLGEDGTWTAVSPDARVDLEQLAAGLEAYPAERLPGLPEPAPEAAAPPPAADSGEPLVLPIVAIAAALVLAGLLARRELAASRAMPPRAT